MPTTVNDILIARNDAASAVDAQLTTTGNLQKPGDGGKMIPSIKRLQAKKTEIMTQACTDILDHADLDAALTAMQTATNSMNTVAKNMTTVTAVLNKINEFLGYGTAAVNALKSINKP
jgi:hypothetical protein